MSKHKDRSVAHTALVLSAALSFPAFGQATTNPEAAKAVPVAAKYTGPVNEGWWNDAVFYQVFVRSFADSSKDNGKLANDGVGDIRGLIERLDYINTGKPGTTTDLKATGIWLMPITKSPSYHGYDTTDYYTIEPSYGTNEDFKELLAECHKRGIKVIIDLVINHCSDDHPWFKRSIDPKSEYHDWFIWSKEDPKWRGPWNQQVWHKKKSEFYYGLFSHRMPDFNYRNLAVTAEINKMIGWWLDEMKVDGFRLDAIRHLIEEGQVQENTESTHAWLRGFYKFYKEKHPQAWTVGEVWAPTAISSSFSGDQMDSCFEFELADTILKSIVAGDATKLAKVAQISWEAFPRNQASTFLTNHDQGRVMNQLGKDEGKCKLAASILLTMPGIPFVYYGEELGMTGDKPDELIRTPMQWDASAHGGFSSHKPWQPLNEDFKLRNVEAQGKDPESLLSLYRKLIRLRNDHVAFRRGDFTVIDAGNPAVFAFVRSQGAERFVVIANLSDKPVEKYSLGLRGEVLAGLDGQKDLLHGAELWESQSPVKLEPLGCYVIKLK
jgi:glycosidase